MSSNIAIILFIIAALVGVIILLLMALLRKQESSASLDATSVTGLEEFILIDPETGMYNKRFFHKKLEEEIYRSTRYNAFFSVNIFDLEAVCRGLDHEKMLTVLRKAGTLIARDTRFTDIVARTDTYKLSLILSMTSKKNSPIPIERIKKSLTSLLEAEGLDKNFYTESISFPEDKAEIEKLSINMRE